MSRTRFIASLGVLDPLSRTPARPGPMSRLNFLRGRRAPKALALALAVAMLVVVVRRLAPSTVETIVLTKTELVQTVVATGRVRSVARARLGPAAAGIVRSVLVREGARVRRGQLLVQLDDAGPRAQLDQARASVAQAEAALAGVGGLRADVNSASLRSAEVALDKATQDYQRMERLVAAGASAAEQLSLAKQQLEVARSNRDIALAQGRALAAGGSDQLAVAAQVAQARAALAVADARVADTKIKAPADGRVLTREVEPGDAIGVGQVVMELALDGPTQLVAIPDEKDLARLADSQPAMASADAFPSSRFTARVSYVAPSIDPAQGTVEVRLDVDSTPSYLRPDMTVSVQIETARRQGVLALPIGAVEAPATDTAWVRAVRGGRVVRQPVRLGLRGDLFVEVVNGLTEGEQVVAPSVGGIAIGARVRPKSAVNP